ncbi:MAG: ABC transporter ATP-binding protein [Pseudomonadota bacterium]
MTATSRLSASDIAVSLGHKTVLQQFHAALPDGALTTIVGPNGSGKSTLLRALARLIPVSSGTVYLDGQPILGQKTRAVARRLAILPQKPVAPEGLSVRELVRRGRTPYQTAFRQGSEEDASAIADALSRTGLADLAERPLNTLSGGQQQRAWIAMTLAQGTEILLLDEPTAFLDLAHQVELLALVRGLNREGGKTVAIVLHDINLAARYADHMIALKDGRVHAEGTPEHIVTEPLMAEVFGLTCKVIADPIHGKPFVIPA